MPRAFWLVEPGVGEIRTEPPIEPGPDEVLVRTLHTGVSRGTETLVFTGRVPAAEYERMRAPFQDGGFPGPVKYGYLNVGVVEQGALAGQTVFCLFPHQTSFVVPAAAVLPVPAGVPASRAVLAGTLETAINALWDGPPLIGDRVAVVGAGMVGCCVARLLARIPGCAVTLVDVDPARAAVADRLGVGFAVPDRTTGNRDLVVHTSATAAGLRLSLDLLAAEGAVTELSWYGDQQVCLDLGGRFHSGRLGIRASQVGRVGRPNRTSTERLALALELLADPAFDALLTGRSPFEELPSVLARMAAGDLPGLCQLIDYPED